MNWLTTVTAEAMSGQVISYMRGPLLFIFNFHPTNSYEGYYVGVEEAGEYQVSDDPLCNCTCLFSGSK
ncbi:1,4-alpha-glucan-branching enzyme 3, chloroplastic/amyloplastic [Vitis vinifera]|uniref:1,4-alpha-glucan-branching enzyme 3, chloroplastic/amyloplastic n=1 Tax=Vitis vinifera TaxID=29760 RepID=A0A438IS29_VITVI|nr:1,4-alpha-glucan-branching enzyme 3, chloroplastic/amyloplastic [Vitis vinifera]